MDIFTNFEYHSDWVRSATAEHFLIIMGLYTNRNSLSVMY